MTNPPATRPVENVSFAASVAQGPDGKPWGVLHLSNGIMQAAVFVSPEGCDQLAADLPTMFRDLAAEVRRQRGGLVIATTLPNTQEG